MKDKNSHYGNLLPGHGSVSKDPAITRLAAITRSATITSLAAITHLAAKSNVRFHRMVPPVLCLLFTELLRYKKPFCLP